MLARASALARVGPFAADVTVGEGLDWLLRASELGLVEVTIPELVVWRRVHGANHTLQSRAAFSDYPRLLKASLDRRKAAREREV
jgi:hypothetical protein